MVAQYPRSEAAGVKRGRAVTGVREAQVEQVAQAVSLAALQAAV